MSSNKIDSLVDFPLVLDMQEYVIGKEWMKEVVGTDDLIYDLFAVSNHYGGIGDTAYAKNHVSMEWYEFDDSRTRRIDENDVVSGAAYLLFYERRNGKSSGLEDMIRFRIDNPPTPPLPPAYTPMGMSLKSSKFSLNSPASSSGTVQSEEERDLKRGKRGEINCEEIPSHSIYKSEETVEISLESQEDDSTPVHDITFDDDNELVFDDIGTEFVELPKTENEEMFDMFAPE